MRFPEFLKEHGTIGFVAPSFGCATEPYYTAFAHARERFGQMGYHTQMGPNCLVDKGIGISNDADFFHPLPNLFRLQPLWWNQE